ncbi:MAG TPA: protease, partial [Chloroflexi bacterium]|nr:protease [Chloroflexota bacterium]
MRLQGKKIAALVTDGFEQIELTSPKQALEEAGAVVDTVSPKEGKVKAWNHTRWGDEFKADVGLGDAGPADYDALLLPGGVMNPDKLRTIPEAVNFARAFFERGKPIAAICHGPWLLVEADVVKGYDVTGYKSLKTDLKNAGANFHDKAVVIDRGLVTSRNPDDLPVFNQAMIEEFAEGTHGGDGQRWPARE